MDICRVNVYLMFMIVFTLMFKSFETIPMRVIVINEKQYLI